MKPDISRVHVVERCCQNPDKKPSAAQLDWKKTALFPAQNVETVSLSGTEAGKFTGSRARQNGRQAGR